MDARVAQAARPGWIFFLAWMPAALAGAAVGLRLCMPLRLDAAFGLPYGKPRSVGNSP